MICPFCNDSVEEFHRRSHIIPEWMYSDCYDDKHKIIEVSRIDERATRRQKGMYNSFLCKKCEEDIQKYDHYASLILSNLSSLAASLSVKKEYFREPSNGGILEYARWCGIDFKKFQNFVYSIILRAFFAQNSENPISLTQKQFNGIMSIYKSNKLDDTSYPISILEYAKGDKMNKHVVLPYVSKILGHHVIEFAGGGYLFHTYVSSHTKPRYVTSLSLKKDGSMYTAVEYFSKTGLYNGMIKIVKSIKEGPRSL